MSLKKSCLGEQREILRVERLQIHFSTPRGRVYAVNNATFSITRGEIFGLVGESGCGKSVTALSILRLLPANAVVTSGKVLFKTKNLLGLTQEEMREIRGQEIAMIFQDPQSSLDPVFTIKDQISEAILIHRHVNDEAIDREVLELMRDVEIPDGKQRKEHYPHQFSGGMKQRTMAAMAIANRPSLIIADEPTTAVDVTIQAQLIHLFRRLRKNYGLSMLLITHDMGLAAEICDRVGVMYAGNIVEISDIYTLFERPRHPYTRGLIESVPRVDVEKEKLEFIPGRVPSPLNPPSNCPFQPRCKYAREICASGVPEMSSIDEKTEVACYLAQRDEI